MNKFILTLLMVCMLLIPAVSGLALADEEYKDEAESNEPASYEVLMDYEPMTVMIYEGISIAIPASFTENEVSEEVAAAWGVIRSFTSANGAFDLQILLKKPATPDEYVAEMDALGAENMKWIHINDTRYLTYKMPQGETFFAVAFVIEQEFALEFLFVAPDIDYLGDLHYQILGTFSLKTHPI